MPNIIVTKGEGDNVLGSLVFNFHYPKEAPISPEISKNYKDLATNKNGSQKYVASS